MNFSSADNSTHRHTEQLIAKLSAAALAQQQQPALIRDRVLSNSSISSTSTSTSNYSPENFSHPMTLLQNHLQQAFMPAQYINMNFLLSLIAPPQLNGGMYYPQAQQTLQNMGIQSTFPLLSGQKQEEESINLNSQKSTNTTPSGSVFIPKPIRQGQTSLSKNSPVDSSSALSSSSQDSVVQQALGGQEGLSGIQYQPNIIFDQVLSPEQMQRRRILRREKIEQYLQKKQSRRWDVLRYEVRKKIAKTRLRVKGRFVKEEDPVNSKSETTDTTTTHP